MNLGAGRIVYQDLTRIDAAIEDGSFFDNPELRAAFAAKRPPIPPPTMATLGCDFMAA